MQKEKEGFSSIFGFLMVIIGFAVGVGSLWRFPYVCGALFILIYLAVIIFIGIPLLTAENSRGFHTQKTAVDAYKTLAPGKKWYFAGYLHMLAALMVFAYTVPIYAWVITYIFRTATGFFTGMDAAGIATAFDALNADPKTMFISAIINWALVAIVIKGGLQGSVEKISTVILPLLAVIMIICIIIGLRTPGAFKGVEFMFMPNYEDFTFSSFTTALGQAFFAIGIGMLASMVFGSYIKKKDASIISFAIICAGIAAGLMIFPIVFAFDLEPAAGTGLSLITLPNAFNAVAGGRIIGTIFYIGFYIAAFSSAIGIGEAVVGAFMDVFNISRGKALALIMAFAVIIGSISILNLDLFDKMDIITCNYLVVIGAFIIAVFVGWIWGAENFLNAANIQNACPVAVVVIFLGNFL